MEKVPWDVKRSKSGEDNTGREEVKSRKCPGMFNVQSPERITPVGLS